MKISCEIDKSLPNVVRETAERRVESKFSRFASVIEEVKLTLKDINGPRGGVDAECLVAVHLRNMPEVIIQQRSESFGKAMYNALERAAQNVARNLQKRTELHQKGASRIEDPAFAQ